MYFPKDDFVYDHDKTRAENYLRLRKSIEEDADPKSLNESWKRRATRLLNGRRFFKGAHLDWNYTEMVRDLIEQGLVKVPISDIEVIFVEWASGNLDNIKREFKYEKAWCDWDGEEWPGCYNSGKRGLSHWWNKCCDLEELHKYTDSNREEFTPSPATAETTPVVPTVLSPATVKSSTETVEPKQFLNAVDALQSTVQQPTPVQYGGNQYIIPSQQQQSKSWIPNVDYVDPNFIPEWERELMMKEAMMGAHGREILRQMGMIPQYQPPQYQTVPNIPQQSLRFTSPEQVVSYIMGNEPSSTYNGLSNEDINNALEGTFIGADD